jgi:hypothetical protein
MKFSLFIPLLLIVLSMVATNPTENKGEAWYDTYFQYLEKLFGISVPSETGCEDRDPPVDMTSGGNSSVIHQDSLLESPQETEDTDKLISGDKSESHLEQLQLTEEGLVDSQEESLPCSDKANNNNADSCHSCHQSEEPSPLEDHPYIHIENITEIACREYVVIRFTLELPLLEEKFSAKVSNYDVLLLREDTFVEVLQILPPFPLMPVTYNNQRNHDHLVTFYPWNAERLTFGERYIVQVRLLGPSFLPLVDPDRGMFLASTTEPFLLPKCA